MICGLKVGNQVYVDFYDDEPIEVHEINELEGSIFNSVIGDVPFVSIRPIPISEDLLSQLMFTETVTNGTVKFKLDDLVINKTNKFVVEHLNKEIKYLHELQNIKLK